MVIIGKAKIIVTVLLLVSSVEAARQSIPVSVVVGSSHGQPLRALQTPGQCIWVKEVKKEFCCSATFSQSDCDAEYEWFMEDNLEELEQAERKQEAAELNDTAGKVIQWVTIAICAICCPLLIIVSIVMCIAKRKEAKQRAQIDAIQGKNFQAGINMADSSDDGMDFVQTEQNRRNQLKQTLEKAQLKRQSVVTDKLRDYSDKSHSLDGSSLSSSQVSSSSQSQSDSEQGGANNGDASKLNKASKTRNYSITDTQATQMGNQKTSGALQDQYMMTNLSQMSAEGAPKSPLVTSKTVGLVGKNKKLSASMQ